MYIHEAGFSFSAMLPAVFVDGDKAAVANKHCVFKDNVNDWLTLGYYLKWFWVKVGAWTLRFLHLQKNLFHVSWLTGITILATSAMGCLM